MSTSTKFKSVDSTHPVGEEIYSKLPLTDAQRRALSTKLLLGYDGLREVGITYHRGHLWLLIKKKRFPKPVALGTGRYGRKAWRASDIQSWLESLPLIKLADEEA